MKRKKLVVFCLLLVLVLVTAHTASAQGAPAAPPSPAAPATAPSPPQPAAAPAASPAPAAVPVAATPALAQNNSLEKRLVNISMIGARTLLYLLFALSILCIAVAIEKYVQYRRENPLGADFRARLVGLLDKGDRAGAQKEVEGVRGVNAALVREGLLNFDEGPATVEEIISSRLILERGRLEKRLMILGTIGNNAPFIGLLGTVMGIIKAFHDLSTAAMQGPQSVMAGISEALIATAVGLFVAIPAVILFNWLKARSKGLLDEAEANAKIVLAFAKRAREANHGGQ
jgi:biopolymer transport protein ExbB